MHTVLGLSLTSDDLTWALVNSAARTVVDHDALEFPADTEIAGAAARGAHAIAMAGGLHVDRVRLTWSDDVAADGLRLRAKLSCLGFDHIEAVPLISVLAVPVEAGETDMAPRLALAYGAALAEVDLADAITVPVRQIGPRRRSRRKMVAAVLGVAATAAVGALLITAASEPRVEPAVATAEQPTSPDSGWVSVTAPPNAAPQRIVVANPTEVAPELYTAPQVFSAAQPVPQATRALSAAQPVAVAPQPVAEAPPQPVAETVVAPTEEAHLPTADQPHLPGTPEALPLAGPAEVPSAPLPGPDMTVPENVFTALP